MTFEIGDKVKAFSYNKNPWKGVVVQIYKNGYMLVMLTNRGEFNRMVCYWEGEVIHDEG